MVLPEVKLVPLKSMLASSVLLPELSREKPSYFRFGTKGTGCSIEKPKADWLLESNPRSSRRLIVLSSVLGAILIVGAMQLDPVMEGLLFVILVAVGVVVQAILMRQDRSRRPSLFNGRSRRFG